jgi:ketosteroid isomerase-like protein
VAIDALVTRADSCAVADIEDFHRDFLPRFIDAQRAYHDGDAEPNNALWSTTDQVSLFAARGLGGVGTQAVMETFSSVASWFSDVQGYEWEHLVSEVSGDLAYTVTIERYTASRQGRPPALSELRATHVFLRKNGHWRAVHRHADRKPSAD